MRKRPRTWSGGTLLTRRSSPQPAVGRKTQHIEKKRLSRPSPAARESPKCSPDHDGRLLLLGARPPLWCGGQSSRIRCRSATIQDIIRVSRRFGSIVGAMELESGSLSQGELRERQRVDTKGRDGRHHLLCLPPVVAGVCTSGRAERQSAFTKGVRDRATDWVRNRREVRSKS